MVVPFVNRVDELAALSRWWATGRAAVVWGRRRVGKTALLARFAATSGHPAVFHTGVGRDAQGELAQLSRQVAQTLKHPFRDLASRPYTSWDDALDDLATQAASKPLLLVLDEFPELLAGTPELPGILRAFLDRAAGHTQLRVLLCGSAVRHMELLQEQRAPLYGRFELSLQVHAFRPHEAALMLDGMAPEEQALVYGLLGGVPLYLSWWDKAAPVTANLARLAAAPGALLLTEGELILATEAEAGELPSRALLAISSGKTTYSEIKTALGAEPARTLDRLIALRLVERVAPVTETARSRRAYYRVADNFLSFYLTVLMRYRVEIERGLGSTILPVMAAGLDDFMGARWEEMFRSHLRRLAVEGALGPEIVAIGPWWSTDAQTELDAVVLAGWSRTPVAVGEAKWTREVSGRELTDVLLRKARALPDVGDAPVRAIVGARSKVVGPPEGTLVVTAANIMSP